MEKNKLMRVFWGIVLLVVLIIVGYFTLFQRKPYLENYNSYKPATIKPANVSASTFAKYQEIPVNVKPSVALYTVKPDLSNVSNVNDFPLSPQAKSQLAKNYFVVTADYNREFYPLYEGNRYAYMPSFVTTDSMLHNYHLMFDHILEKVEEQKLFGQLKIINASMLEEAMNQYTSLKDTPWQNAAKRNVAFFTVASKLLDPSVTVPDFVKKEVNQELSLIDAHQALADSAVMNIGAGKDVVLNTPQGPQGLESLKEDYSQYIPRGHYDKTEQLQAYFKSMMWYGRLTFRLKNDDEIRSAILITLALNKNDNQKNWDSVYEPVNFFVGKSDDITYYQFKDVLKNVYGQGATLPDVVKNKDKFVAFVNEAKKLEPPQLNSIPIFNSDIQPDREKEIKGFRFMGQRFTIDASVFQRLIDREVPGRMLPKGLDVPAAFGSDEALSILTDMGETKYPHYLQNMNAMRSYISSLPQQNWSQNLYWGWLNALRPLTEVKPAGYPSFMQNKAWLRKDLNTFLASWTELKHDTILYSKQVYAELGGGGPDQKDDRGYVEPDPQVYARLAALLQMTIDGLESRNLLSSDMKENLANMKQLSLSFKTISEKELQNQKLSDYEYELIRSYGGQLEHFWLEVNKDEPQFKTSTSQRDYLNENPAALVADVATDPNGTVLEEANGYVLNIYVIVPIDENLRIAQGGVYSYYEFPRQISDRLTDKKWRHMLYDNNTPELPSWTNTFTAK